MENVENSGKNALQNVLDTKAINDKVVEKKDGIGPEGISVISDALVENSMMEKELKIEK